MASISHDGGGFRRLLFNVDGKRSALYLGKMSLKAATTVKDRVEAIIEAKAVNRSIDAETASWLRAIDDDLYAKLAKTGLVTKRADPGASTLGPFIDAFIASRTDVKSGTLLVFGHARRNLLEYFGPDKRLTDVSQGDADEWRRWLNERLGESTAGRRCGVAKQFFRAAVRKRLIAENPFADMKGIGGQRNRERFYFISRAEAAKVLEACPNNEWRLLFALSRYGGLRCPSEHLRLRWSDVDLPGGRMTVHSPKTEHHAGKESRVVPIFPELRPYLEIAWDEAAEGAEFVITRCRESNANLRTQLQRFIKRAGLKPWPKLFQNLRSTRQTELAEEFPSHVACAWIGNSEDIAREHYLQVTDQHFAKAAQITAQSGANSSRPEATEARPVLGKCFTVGSGPELSACTVGPV